LSEATEAQRENAKRSLAAFKFSLFETVVADPRLKGAPCTDLIIVYAGFVTIDDAGNRTPAFATNDTVNARAAIKCHKTAKRARTLLENFGYLVPHSRRNGVTIYNIANPNADSVAEHVTAAAEKLREAASIRKADERTRTRQKDTRSGISPTPDDAKRSGDMPDLGDVKVGRNTHPRVGDMPDQGRENLPPITLEDTLDGNLGKSSAYEDRTEGTYTRDRLAQPQTKGEASKPVVTQPSTSVGEKKKNTQQHSQTNDAPAAPASSPPHKPNSYLAAKEGRAVSTKPFPVPRNEAAGRQFLRENHVPESEWRRLLPELMAGYLAPYDIEPWMDAA
jgi:hypothetical protein